jgi:hypothetical protein
MPALIQGTVGVGNYADAAAASPRLGSQGEFINSDMNGQFYEQVLRGNAFVYSTAAAGVTWLAPTATQNMPMLWNPAGSGKNFVLWRTVAGYVSGTHVPGFLEYAVLLNAGSQIGTAAPVVSLTQVAGTNLLIGAGKASVMRFAPATVTVITAPTYLCSTGISFATGAAATAMDPWTMSDEVQGRIIVPPGNALFLCSNAVSTIVGTLAFIGLELVIPTTTS